MRLKNLLIIFLIPWLGLNAQELWIPSKLQITPTGEIKHNFPFPTTANPGAAFKSVDPNFAGIKIGIGGDITNFKRIFAISGKDSGELKETSTGVFLAPDDSAGYRVLETKNATVSLNIAASTTLVGGWMGIAFDFGVSGSYGRGYLSNRFVPTLAAAEKLPVITFLPKTPEEIKKDWFPGDSVSVNRTMGVGFDASIGSKSYFKVGVVAKIDSTWNVTLAFPEKKDNPKGDPMVVVSFGRQKDKKFSVAGSNLLGDISWEKVWGKSETFTFHFDLSNTQKTNIDMEEHTDPKKIKKVKLTEVSAFIAYQEALKGNLYIAERLHLLKSFGVKKISEEEKISKSSKMAAGMTIPWLFRATYKQGKTYSKAKVEKVGDEKMIENILAFYSQESGTNGIVSADLKRLNMFSGNFQQVTPLTTPDVILERRYSGNYKYHYAKNRVSTENFEDELKKLRYRVGFMTELKEFQNIPKEIGSLQIDLDIAVSNLATDELINLALKYPAQVFEKEALAYIDGFFENVTDAKAEICKHYKVRVIEECIYTTKRQSSTAMQKAHKALLKMRDLKLKNNYIDFVSAFADFGEGFIENRFTMKTFLRMLRYEFNPNITGRDKFGAERKIKGPDGKLIKIPYEVSLNIKGTNLAPYNKILYSWKNP